MSLYNKGSFIDLCRKPYILSPFDRFTQDLECSFYGKHSRDDCILVDHLDSKLGLLGVLKSNLQSNHSSAYDYASWEYLGAVLRSFPQPLRGWSKQLGKYVRNHCLSYEVVFTTKNSPTLSWLMKLGAPSTTLPPSCTALTSINTSWILRKNSSPKMEIGRSWSWPLATSAELGRNPSV